MGLRDYVPPREEIEIAPGNTMTLRGLSFDDISKLVVKHGPVLTFMYQRFADEKAKGFTAEGMGELIVSAMDQFPEAIAYLIALAADEPEAADVARKLRPTIQAQAIEKIIGLTFVSEAELKNLVETVTRMMSGAAASVAQLTAVTPSVSGNGAFASN